MIKKFLHNSSYQLLLYIIPIMLTQYKFRILGKENMGIYGYVYSIFYSIVLISSIGINKYGRKKIIESNNLKVNKKLVFDLSFLKFLISLLLLIIYLIIFANSEYYKLLILFIPTTLLYSFDISWYFEAKEKYKFLNFMNFIIKFIYALIVIILIKNEHSLYMYTFISNLFLLIPIMIGFILFYKNNKTIKYKLDILSFKIYIKPCFILLLSDIFIQLYSIVDKLMIERYCDNISYVGYYDYSFKFINIFITLIRAFAIVLIPISIKEKNINKFKKFINKSICYSIIFSIISIIFISFASKYIILLLLGENYIEMIDLINLLSFSILPIGVTTIISENYLIGKNKEKYYIIISFLGFILNIIFNRILVVKYNIFGIIYSTIIIENIIMIIEIILLYKYNKKTKET